MPMVSRSENREKRSSLPKFRNSEDYIKFRLVIKTFIGCKDYEYLGLTERPKEVSVWF